MAVPFSEKVAGILGGMTRLKASAVLFHATTK
jgi:hypothetical protein